MIRLRWILPLLLLSPTWALAMGSAPAVTVDREGCRRLYQNVAASRNFLHLQGCMDYFFLHQEDDFPEKSFNAVIALGRRSLELEPHDTLTYTLVAWFLWSKWVSWKEDPEQMPDGALKKEEAVALLISGAAQNAHSGLYFFEAALSLWPLAQHHDPKIYELILPWWEKADRLLPLDEISHRIRLRLNLGHSYRDLKQAALARFWYERALDASPTDPVATHEIACLNRSHECRRKDF